MPIPEFVVQVQRLEERIEEGLGRLGAHLEKDTRSFEYGVQKWITDQKLGQYQTDPTKLKSQRWSRAAPILDQGDLGSCTGNAGVGMLSLGHLHNEVVHRFPTLKLDEQLAVAVYGRATRMDGFGQPFYPSNDRGSSTLGMLKALQSMGFIDNYYWGFGLVDVLNLLALVGGPCIGVMWYSGFDEPSKDGELKIGGEVRGGHELVLDELDVKNRRAWGDNSWGLGFAKAGRFWVSWDTLDHLLHDQGEVGVGVRH